MKGITLMGKDGIGIAHQLDAIAPKLGLSSAESLQVMNQLVWLNLAEQANEVPCLEVF